MLFDADILENEPINTAHGAKHRISLDNRRRANGFCQRFKSRVLVRAGQVQNLSLRIPMKDKQRPGAESPPASINLKLLKNSDRDLLPLPLEIPH